MSTITIAILIFVVTLILYGVNKFSMGTVGMITMAALLVTGCLAPKDALGYFANKNVILMLSMFVVSAGLSRTTFLDAFSDTIVKLAKGSFKRTYLCYIVMAVILTNLLSSPLVVFTILLPLVDSMCKRYEISPSKVMFPIGLCCVACCCIMPFGAAIGQSALYNGFLESYGYDIAFTPLDFFKGRWPFLLIVPAWAFTMGYKIAPEKPITDVASVVVSGKTKQKLNKFADIAGVVIFFGVVVLCCVSDKIGVERCSSGSGMRRSDKQGSNCSSARQSGLYVDRISGDGRRADRNGRRRCHRRLPVQCGRWYEQRLCAGCRVLPAAFHSDPVHAESGGHGNVRSYLPDGLPQPERKPAGLYGADHGRFADCVYDSDGNQLHPCRDGRRRI